MYRSTSKHFQLWNKELNMHAVNKEIKIKKN